jgi:hypothetical protein
MLLTLVFWCNRSSSGTFIFGFVGSITNSMRNSFFLFFFFLLGFIVLSFMKKESKSNLNIKAVLLKCVKTAFVFNKFILWYTSGAAFSVFGFWITFVFYVSWTRYCLQLNCCSLFQYQNLTSLPLMAFFHRNLRHLSPIVYTHNW